MKVIKMNALLAKVDNAASVFKKQVQEYLKFFDNKQGAFLGERQTYDPKEGVVDDPSKRKHLQVTTTVREKLDYFKAQAADYFDNLMNVEKSNASGVIKANLIVDDEDWGEFTSLELLRLKGFLEAQGFVGMLNTLPVRSDSVSWALSSDPDHQGRDIFQTPLVETTVRTTEKEQYILDDPNLARLKDASSYKPQIAVRTTVIELGEHTRQMYSGEITHVQRAKALERRSKLYQAVIVALKEANENFPVESTLKYERVHGYILGHI